MSDRAEALLRTRARREAGRRSRLWFLLSILMTALLIYMAFGLLFGLCRVRGASMEPTLREGDILLFSRLEGTYRQGDLVVFPAGDGTNLVKRVVATGGQTVDLDGEGGLLVDGLPLEEGGSVIGPTLAGTDGDIEFPVTVEAGCVFVLGDNRPNSTDSRDSAVGQVAQSEITGRIVLLLLRTSVN